MNIQERLLMDEEKQDAIDAIASTLLESYRHYVQAELDRLLGEMIRYDFKNSVRELAVKHQIPERMGLEFRDWEEVAVQVYARLHNGE